MLEISGTVTTAPDGEAILRLTDLTRERFEQEYLGTGRPVVVSREPAAWGPAAGWTPEYLAARLDSKSVSVAVSAGGVFHYDPAASKTFDLKKLAFREAAAAICAPDRETGIYLMQQSIAQSFPELADEVRPPDLLGEEPAAAHLWFGSAGNVTPLHYDPLNNFFLQLHGRKRFTLFSPRFFEELYPFPIEARFSHISHVDAERPDLEKHPRFLEARRHEVVLGPGDLLFLPAFWWHHVRSLDVAVSLNFWSAPSLADCLASAGLRLLSAVYERDRLATMGAPFRRAEGGFLAAAREVQAHGPRWAAVMLAGAAVELPLRAICRDKGIADRTADGLRPLAAINRELAEAGTYPAAQAEAIGRLDEAFERARLRRDELFTDEDVAEIVLLAGELCAP